MSDADQANEPTRKKGSKLILFAALAAVLLGGASFYAVHSGLVVLPFTADAMPAQENAEQGGAPAPMLAREEDGPLPAFVALEPMVISLGPEAEAEHLKLRLEIEVAPEASDAVAALRPRIADVLNGFLRAVDERVLAEPRAMARLRAQMLRRVQLVTPQGATRDLLVQEFVLN